jgi:hypothetical protein
MHLEHSFYPWNLQLEPSFRRSRQIWREKIWHGYGFRPTNENCLTMETRFHHWDDPMVGFWWYTTVESVQKKLTNKCTCDDPPHIAEIHAWIHFKLRSPITTSSPWITPQVPLPLFHPTPHSFSKKRSDSHFQETTWFFSHLLLSSRTFQETTGITKNQLDPPPIFSYLLAPSKKQPVLSRTNSILLLPSRTFQRTYHHLRVAST